MLEEKIRMVPVWPRLLRAAHWLMAAGVLFQLASGWLAQRISGDEFWRDWHLMAGQALLLVLVLRFALLFGAGSGHWWSFVPTATTLKGARQTLVFYITLGKAPLANWSAHNPLWQFLYPFLLVLILATVASGLGYHAPYLIGGAAPAAIHAATASLVGGLAVAHMVTVVLHDLKGKGAFVSAMINGNRYFHVAIQPDGLTVPQQGQTVDVSFDRAAKGRSDGSGSKGQS